ncbi:MAG TPA: hypothetical protein VK714_11315 [Myxococcota bacterium]|nr:hypothetical protein [Myxococcota bacterium]
MKRAAFVVSLGVLLLLGPSPSSARGGGPDGGFHDGFHGGFHGFGHGFGFRGPRVALGFGPAFGWWGAAYPWSWCYPPPHYGYASPNVIAQQPPENVEPGEQKIDLLAIDNDDMLTKTSSSAQSG